LKPGGEINFPFQRNITPGRENVSQLSVFKERKGVFFGPVDSVETLFAITTKKYPRIDYTVKKAIELLDVPSRNTSLL